MSLAVDEGITPCCCSVIVRLLTGERKHLDAAAVVEEGALWSAVGSGQRGVLWSTGGGVEGNGGEE